MGTYHPAALERAADSINGVETQGLGISLPMIEIGFYVFEAAANFTRMRTSSSRQLKDSRSIEGRGRERRTGFRVLSDSALLNV